METRITASKLRENVYRILDRVIETGTPVEIERSGHILRIVCDREAKPSRLENLEPHPDALKGRAEDIVHLDWSGNWRP